MQFSILPKTAMKTIWKNTSQKYDALAQNVEGKQQTNSSLHKIKDKSQNLLTLENCVNRSIPLTNKKIWDQLNNHHKKSDLNLINISETIKINTAALARVTDGLLQPTFNIKEKMKRNLEAIPLFGHLSQDLSSFTC